MAIKINNCVMEILVPNNNDDNYNDPQESDSVIIIN